MQQTSLAYFAVLPDPRRDTCKQYLLPTLSCWRFWRSSGGTDNFVAIEAFGAAQPAWLKSFLTLENGMPSHVTLRRLGGAKIRCMGFGGGVSGSCFAIRKRLCAGKLCCAAAERFESAQTEHQNKREVKAKRLSAGWDNEFL